MKYELCSLSLARMAGPTGLIAMRAWVFTSDLSNPWHLPLSAVPCVARAPAHKLLIFFDAIRRAGETLPVCSPPVGSAALPHISHATVACVAGPPFSGFPASCCARQWRDSLSAVMWAGEPGGRRGPQALDPGYISGCCVWRA